MAPTTVRVVLVEGENADGATVDEDNIAVTGDSDPATFSAPDQVVSAILGTREGADEAGYQLRSTGVTWTDQRAAAELRDALAARKVENVMLVSSFLAAAALAQSLGSATGYARNALLYVEPDTATLAVVNTSDGSIVDVQRETLPDDDDQAVATLVNLASAAEGLDQQPEGLLVVGSGVDIPLIKPALEDATSLPLSVPDHPETALARGAALASASAPLFASSTAALAYALDPGTGSVSQHADAPGYLAVAEAAVPHPDAGPDALAYSAVADDSAAVYTQAGADAYEPEDFTTGMYPDFGRLQQEHDSRRPFLVAMGVLLIFVTGVMGLVVSLAFSIRPTANTRPSLSHNVVAPARVPAPAPAPAAPPAPAPAAAPVQAPAPPAAPAPVHAAVPAPAPAPPPAFVPAPAPPPAIVPAPVPIPIAPILPGIPGLGPPPPAWGGPHGGDHGPWGHGGGPGWGGPGGGHGGGGWGHGGGGWGHGGFGHGR
ncbi:hypothetical protein A5658_05820 [Mycobacterium sp. 1245111.1]|uniref:DUF7159 family protein n=1 Tax=Mycobacterium sp. 1245111.1 TaxID=1834073 RepID=UPI0007FE481B|nr:hypothetical protein [Mycobacterium sp. 1245111.1]OBK36721.1 hypothetical protein A5658_05820 [Mycobacterium sp. 1245111.1]